MGPVSGLVLFAVIWFMTFFVALPIRISTQGDEGAKIRGTHAGAPEHHHLKRKAFWTTIVALVLWAIIASIILSGIITVDAIEQFMGGRAPVTLHETDG